MGKRPACQAEDGKSRIHLSVFLKEISRMRLHSLYCFFLISSGKSAGWWKGLRHLGEVEEDCLPHGDLFRLAGVRTGWLKSMGSQLVFMFEIIVHWR